MIVTLDRINEHYLLEAKGPRGIPVRIDDQVDGVTHGASPMELLLMGVGGCSAIDMISILTKQRQKISSYKVEVEGIRKQVGEARPFKSICVKIFLEGEIKEVLAKKAGILTFEKYCSVSITLKGCVDVTHQIFVNGNLI